MKAEGETFRLFSQLSPTELVQLSRAKDAACPRTSKRAVSI